MYNLRAFKVVFLPATDTKLARVKITDLRFNQTIIGHYSASGKSQGTERAIEMLGELGINIGHQAWSEGLAQNYTILLTDNFTIKLK